MSKISRFSGVLLILLMSIGICGCLLERSDPNKPPSKSNHLLFSCDFSDDEIGALPSKLTTQAGTENVKVISDETAVGGKALQVLADPDKVINLVTGEMSTDAPIVAVEFSVRYPKGNAVNFHLKGISGYPNGWVSWYLDGQTSIPSLGYRYSSTGKKHIGYLDTSWNRLRVEADRLTGEVYVYLINASGEIKSEALGFRESMTSWEHVALTFECTWREPLNEVYIDDIEIWGIYDIEE